MPVVKFSNRGFPVSAQESLAYSCEPVRERSLEPKAMKMELLQVAYRSSGYQQVSIPFPNCVRMQEYRLPEKLW